MSTATAIPAVAEPPSHDSTAPPPPESDSHPTGGYLATLALGALGVVYGDIGTSPLYAVRESLHSQHGVPLTPDTVLGILSLIFWALISLICVKYLTFVLRADHHGEGGILALATLVSENRRGRFALVMVLGLFGTALLYGDGMITPAISVLSAVEGLEYITPVFKPYILPLTCLILVMLFSLQSRGTDSIGKLFGPTMLVWFSTLGALGVYQIWLHPAILWALSPHYGLAFLLTHGWSAVMALGSVFLVVTGGEALYADLGHFGRRPIIVAWFLVAFPALMLNYLGQGALLLRDPTALTNPFFRMAPSGLLIFLIPLATAATIIASQALISGVFSLATQSVQLGYIPRIRILHTSAAEKGQIYVPFMNRMLMLACVALVLGFGSSSNLAAAYGVAVTITMVITTILLFWLSRYSWGWSAWKSVGLCGFFLCLELVFCVANLTKVVQGGWFPLLVGWALFTAMSTWKKGRQVLYERLQTRAVPLDTLLERLEQKPPTRVQGCAIFMCGNQNATPPALLANLRHNRVLHRQVLLLAVETADRPYLWTSDRFSVTPMGEGFYRVVLRLGYLEDPNVPAALSHIKLDGRPVQVGGASFFLGRETVIPSGHSGLSPFREHLFAFMVRNSVNATAFFNIPPDQVVELGTQLEF